MFKAVIFDMDGLLVDTEPLWQEAEIKIFGELGLKLTNKMCAQTAGFRIDEAVRHWYRYQPWKGVSLQETENRIMNELLALVEKNLVPMAGADYILNFFKERGFKIALASSSFQKIIDCVIDKINVRHYFDCIHSAEHEEFGKPHPAIYLTTAKKLGVEPSSCLAFEDSYNGMLSAKSAGMKTVVVPSQHELNDGKFNAGDLVISSLNLFNDDAVNYLNT